MSSGWKNEREYYLTTLGKLIVDEFNNYNFNIDDYEIHNANVPDSNHYFGVLEIELDVSNSGETFKPQDRYVLTRFVCDIIQDYINNTPANRIKAMNADKGMDIGQDCIDITAYDSLDAWDGWWEDVHYLDIAFSIDWKY